MTAFTRFRDRTAVVTGGASGLGKGIARALIAEGMRVVLADIEAAALERTAAELGATGLVVDVSDAASVQGLAEEVRRRFGAVHLVCNNAGVGSLGRLADLTLEDWHWMVGVNLWGVIHGLHAFLPLLRANPDGGHLVNTASVGGFVTMPGLGAYAVTKHAVVALSETLAQELAEADSPIGVTVLCPGPVRTNIKTSSRNRPPSRGLRGLQDVDLEATDFGAAARWIEPDEVGRILLDALRRGALYAFTHPEQMEAAAQRFETILRAARACE